MTLPVSGAISFNNINVELGTAGTTQAAIGQTSYRTLAGVPSGQIAMNNFWGKSNRVAINLTISSNTNNFDIYGNRGGTYVPGKSDITLTINSGVYVFAYSDVALSTGSGWTSGDTIKIINNGIIIGFGGYPYPGFGVPGGTGLRIEYPTTITNNGIIAGGGGSGGQPPAGFEYGSAGIGAGFDVTGSTSGSNASAGLGTGGAAGVSGANGGTQYCYWDWNDNYVCLGTGGGGGGAGAAGGTSGGYGYWGNGNTTAGGAGGAATSGAGTYATWLATGTRYGTVG